AAYYATTGFMLGIFGAAASLLFNVVGSAWVNQSPLKLIQIYLTFPLGEDALKAEMASGVALAVGCCLYLGTGMLLGVPVYLALTKLVGESADLTKRLVVATVLGIAIWLINFYGILSWLQPMLFGGNWIVQLVPWWVACVTHLVFTWTMAIVYPLGLYRHYESPQSASS
ncbi:MAG: hypothetical protein KDA99_05980, partial [Planctomycetales bacterium]|nr:hypothetical protein [Planctomycetales bacterium]